MAQFILKINLGNEAMQTYSDIAQAVRRIPLCTINPGESGNIRDINGNTVGFWKVE